MSAGAEGWPGLGNTRALAWSSKCANGLQLGESKEQRGQQRQQLRPDWMYSSAPEISHCTPCIPTAMNLPSQSSMDQGTLWALLRQPAPRASLYSPSLAHPSAAGLAAQNTLLAAARARAHFLLRQQRAGPYGPLEGRRNQLALAISP